MNVLKMKKFRYWDLDGRPAFFKLKSRDTEENSHSFLFYNETYKPAKPKDHETRKTRQVYDGNLRLRHTAKRYLSEINKGYWPKTE